MPVTGGIKYYSVIGFGKTHFIEDNGEKEDTLNIIMQKYSNKPNETFEYSKSTLDKTTVIKVEVESLTGKKSGY
ncbi:MULTISPECIES: pyridoxamine 5'-phosphate oxidase family protein [Methanobacterium]|uniref:Uncharacterized protein n=1 Tax=Methanobacterium bryantii TaxID=2161 RepID=A0A2A2H6Z3_METBR|nr:MULTISPECIES: pyridoxamine 5'-phosphate oxidase family protein [Methanobacterium]OEC84998.1 hypothetical protein A9507_01320 [Methanobacterium sp. A39]PAV05148.1 hypothetical protein ASJ80_12745 [Methanobacterium bryantii]